jgi:diamine N-acetyltransferase
VNASRPDDANVPRTPARSAANVAVQPLAQDNFQAVIDLSVAPDQREFVAPNVLSIAQSKVWDAYVPLAICDGDEPVGFALYGRQSSTDWLYIARFMIDQRHQGKGYGRQGLNALIEHMRTEHPGEEIQLSIVPANLGAKRLYESAGFIDTGEVDEDGEMIFRLPRG